MQKEKNMINNMHYLFKHIGYNAIRHVCLCPIFMGLWKVLCFGLIGFIISF